MARTTVKLLILALGIALLPACEAPSGSAGGSATDAGPPQPFAEPTPCDTLTPSATPGAAQPTSAEPASTGPTLLPWRQERLADGSIALTVGDIDEAPLEAGRISDTTYRDGCPNGIAPVHGWWCTMKVAPSLTLTGGRLRDDGATTSCLHRPGKMRQGYGIERSSWSGYRAYYAVVHTGWTTDQTQRTGPVSAPCPAGRVGTYDYRYWAIIEVDGEPSIVFPAATGVLRTSCGTGAS